MTDSSAQALVKRASKDVSLMPPPPLKRIKRPSVVLGEDQYTAALSEIIARDYFPGLLESQAQHEYLAALDSGSEAWIAEAGQKLREAAAPRSSRKRIARNTRFNATPGATPRGPVEDTPVGYTGSQTPMTEAGSDVAREAHEEERRLDTSTLSLGSFQSKYTSEDNESFNTVLDKQNEKRRVKHSHLWTQDQRIPSARQIAHRAREEKLITQKEDDQASGKSLIPLTSGATASRPAKPDSWNIKRPDNTFMFHADSVDEEGIQTVQEVKEQNSKAGPKHVVFSNTRFPPIQYLEDPGAIPPSPSLNTDIITRREASRDQTSRTEAEYNGSETPCVNGYAFVDEDEPENIPVPSESKPSYRDLLAGQVGDATPNPFKISEIRKREDLHLRMVEREAKKKREKDRDTIRAGGSTPGYTNTPATAGSMTPAARRLMQKLGGSTPLRAGPGGGNAVGQDMWTPGRTPRKKHVPK